jgi:DNA-binding NtrC family response regulator
MGKSLKMLKVFQQIKKVALKNYPVLISGERGTYKELVAKSIHYHSLRLKSPFVSIDLTALPKELAEVELFGNITGKASETLEKSKSKLLAANGGTLYLNGIEEMDMNLQDKLLQVIKNKPAEENTAFDIDIRIVCSTSKSLPEMIRKRELRESLSGIFQAAYIRIPPLRERKEDILNLAEYFLTENIKKFEIEPKEFSRDARNFLQKHDWPGNTRELENTIKRATILSCGPVITKKDLMIEDVGLYSLEEFLEEKLKRYLKEMIKLENCNLYASVLSEVEKSLIMIVLKETGFNQLKASKTLGINRNTLRAKIKEYKIHV